MIVRAMDGMGGARVVDILPPKPKPKPKPKPAAPLNLSPGFLDTLPFLPASAPPAAPDVPAGAPSKILGLPRTPAIVGGVVLAVGLGYLVLRR